MTRNQDDQHLVLVPDFALDAYEYVLRRRAGWVPLLLHLGVFLLAFAVALVALATSAPTPMLLGVHLLMLVPMYASIDGLGQWAHALRGLRLIRRIRARTAAESSTPLCGAPSREPSA